MNNNTDLPVITGFDIEPNIGLFLDLEDHEPAMAISLRNGNIQFMEGIGPGRYHGTVLYACNVHCFGVARVEGSEDYILSLSYGSDEIIIHSIGIIKSEDFDKAQDWVERANALYQ